MTRDELMELVTDRICDPWTYCAEDIAVCDPIGIDEAKKWLAEYRNEDEDFEPEDRLPAEVTPDMLMIAWNCLIRKARHDLRVERLAAWLKKNEAVVFYDNYKYVYLEDGIEVIPSVFLNDYDKVSEFPFRLKDGEVPGMDTLIQIGMNSPEFDMKCEYTWYCPESMSLHSSDTPFKDGIIDEVALATYLIETYDPSVYDEILDHMSDEEVVLVFGCGREEVLA